MQKIMFNDRYGLTSAVLEGRKTNTRRAEFSAEEQQVLNEADDVYMNGDDVVAHFGSGEDVRFGTRYKVGEIVAVAQRYADIPAAANMAGTPGWRNKMFGKAELMPHRIRITSIRAERLQDISEEDCINEGIWCDTADLEYQSYEFFGYDNNEDDDFDTLHEAFASLIDKVSGRGTWASNPWVVVYEYELIK